MNSTYLGQISDIQTGPFGSQLHNEDYVQCGSPIVTVEHLGQRNFSQQNLPKVSEEDKRRLSKYIMSEGDIIFSRVGSVDRCSFVSKKYRGWLFSGRCLRVRPDSSKVDPLYLYYYLNLENTKETIRSVAVGATMPSINTVILSELLIELPTLKIQKQISTFLDRIDSKIECNEHINANLDAKLKLLFNEMFMENESIEYGKLGDYCDVQKGLSYKGSGLSESGIPLINLGNITPGGGYRYEKDKFYTGEYKAKNVVKPDDLIIANTDMTYERIILGSPIIVPQFKGDVLFTHHLFALRDVKLPKSYLYYYLRTDLFHGLCESSANGTTVLAITRDDVLRADIPIPSEEELIQFDRIASKELELMSKLVQENNQLAMMRDYLLPKLMSGEIDVSDLPLPN